jgi:hypothetical protein
MNELSSLPVNYTSQGLQLQMDPPNESNTPKQETTLPVDPILCQREALIAEPPEPILIKHFP